MGATIEIDVAVRRLDVLLANVSPDRRATFQTTALTRIILKLQSKVTTSDDFIKRGRGDASPLKTILSSRHGGSGLVGSISPDYSGLPNLASLGSDLPYAGVHEFGSLDGKTRARPYLSRTYEKARKSGLLSDIVHGVLNETVDSAGFK